MRIALLGRTKALLAAARPLIEAGHQIPLIGTCKAESHYGADEFDFRNLSRDIGADFFSSPKLNDPNRTEQLERANCDIALSVNWPIIIGEKSCEVFSKGILNAHLGDLPRYRGNACPNWAILNDEKFVGLCLHRMEPNNLDTGPVLQRIHMEISEKTYVGDVYSWFEKSLPGLAVDAMKKLDRLGEDAFIQQSRDPSAWLRCYPRRNEDSRIDWLKPASEVLRLIRASSHPFGGAWTLLEGQIRIDIWRAKVFYHKGDFLAIPGQVMLSKNGEPIIACGEGALRVTQATAEQNDARALISKSLRARLI